MRHKLITIVTTLAMSFLPIMTATAGESGQVVPITGAEHNMVAYGHVINGNLDLNSGKNFLLSFGPGGDQDCRSRSEMSQDGSFYATIVGNQEGEGITFKVEGAAGQISDLATSIPFAADATLEKLTLR